MFAVADATTRAQRQFSPFVFLPTSCAVYWSSKFLSQSRDNINGRGDKISAPMQVGGKCLRQGITGKLKPAFLEELKTVNFPPSGITRLCDGFIVISVT